MTQRALFYMTAVVLLLLALFALITSSLTTLQRAKQSDMAAACTVGVSTTPPTVSAEVKARQIQWAKFIAGVTKDAGMSGAAARLAILTALDESTLDNLNHGDRDSLGLFQQRPSQGWGTPQQIADPRHATLSFLLGPAHDGQGGLFAVRGWEKMPPWEAVYHVQRSADSQAVRPHIPEADALIAEAGLDLTFTGTRTHTAGSQPPITPGAAAPAQPCSAVDAAGGPVVVAGAPARVVGISEAGLPEFAEQPGCKNTPLLTGPNGSLAPSQLCVIPPDVGSTRGFQLQPAAANALAAMNAAHRLATGRNLCILDGYRSYAQQVAMQQRRGSWAATPGTSNHGYGVAIDLCGSVGFGQPDYTWLSEHAAKYGWIHPLWAAQGSSKPEPWHWEFGTHKLFNERSQYPVPDPKPTT